MSAATLKQCPMCKRGDLYSHCRTSPACDLVHCNRCGSLGSLDGRWWKRKPGQHFRQIENAADELRRDVEDGEQ